VISQLVFPEKQLELYRKVIVLLPLPEKRLKRVTSRLGFLAATTGLICLMKSGAGHRVGFQFVPF